MEPIFTSIVSGKVGALPSFVWKLTHRGKIIWSGRFLWPFSGVRLISCPVTPVLISSSRDPGRVYVDFIILPMWREKGTGWSVSNWSRLAINKRSKCFLIFTFIVDLWNAFFFRMEDESVNVYHLSCHNVIWYIGIKRVWGELYHRLRNGVSDYHLWASCMPSCQRPVGGWRMEVEMWTSGRGCDVRCAFCREPFSS